MKAAVLHQFGGIPRYEDFQDPSPGENEVLIRVKAVALENVDKAMAEGTHFANRQFLSGMPAIVGFDGIGELPDGRLVGFGGLRSPYGSMAEYAVVPEAYTIPVPGGIDAVTAAALPSSAMTSLLPLQWGAKLQPGETVLVNGATGVSGKLAVQIAKLLEASRVIGTGRNPESLDMLKELGADGIIDLNQPEEELVQAFRREAGKGYDVVLDFLWGRPTEIWIKSLIPDEIRLSGSRTRLVQIGEKAGSSITLSADALRTTRLEIVGATTGITSEVMQEATGQVWAWHRNGKLRMDVETVPLAEISEAWKRSDFQGKRLVIIP